MLDPENLAVTLGRALDLFRARPDDVPAQKAALRQLTSLLGLGAAVLELRDGALLAGGRPVGPGLPGIRTLTQQMDAHGVARIALAQRASPADLLTLLRALAVNLGGYRDGGGVAERLRDAGASSVTVQTIVIHADAAAREAPNPAAPPLPVISDPPADPLEAALARLDADFYGPGVLDRASAVAAEIGAALAAERTAAAVGALARLVRLEAGLAEGSPRRSLGIVLKRLLAGAALERVMDALFLPDRRADAAVVLERAGREATERLVERMGAADAVHERRAYFDVLRGLGSGLRAALHLLAHEDWRVARNVAELMGEARVEEAVPGLGRLMRHPEGRVRRAAAVALARIGTPGTADHLRRALRGGDSEVRALVAGALSGRRSGALAMPLALAAEQEGDPALQREYYLALGRIGTADALQILLRAAAPGGRFFGRKPAGPRLAAIEGLRVARDPAAEEALQELAGDRDPAVREAARAALGGLPAS